MKRVFVLLLMLFAALWSYAGEVCDKMMSDAIKRFNEGHFPAAMELFKDISAICPDYKSSCSAYIARCEEGIKAQEQQRRKDAEKRAKARREREAKERAERRESNNYVFLSVLSDVPGKFSGNNLRSDLMANIQKSHPSVRFTNDSLEAYWYVRVDVYALDESSSNDLSCYGIKACVEVENATEMDFETKVAFFSDRGCLSTPNERDVADLIYESKGHHLFRDIETGISRLVAGNGNDTNTSGTGFIQKQKNVVIHVVSSSQGYKIRETLEYCLTANFNKAGGRYKVVNRDEVLNGFLEKEFNYQEEGYVIPKERTMKGDQLGADEVCIVKIVESDKGLWFYCSHVELSTGGENQVLYPSSDRDVVITPSSGIDRIQLVADVLSMKLGLYHGGQDDIDRRMEKAMEEDNAIESSNNAKRVARAFVPGLEQLHNGENLKGGLFIAGEALCIGGAVVSQNMRNINIKKMNSTTNANLKKAYADKANAFTIVRNVGVGAAAAVYVWNVLDALTSKDKKNYSSHYSLYPVVTDETMALTFNVNF